MAQRNLIEWLHTEHKAVSFGIVPIGPIGPIGPSDFMCSDDPALVLKLAGYYEKNGIITNGAMDADDVAWMIVNAFEAPMVVEDLTLHGPNIQ